MNIWIDVMRDIEYLLGDSQPILDAWEEGGVDGMVIGPMMFNAQKLLVGTRLADADEPPMATYDPNPQVYQNLGVEPPAPPSTPYPKRRARLERLLTAVKDRGWAIYIFQAHWGAGPGGDGPLLADNRSQAAYQARMIDTLEHYPMVDGAIMDGPEWGYEIAPHHQNYRSYIFNDLPENVAAKCADLGYDYAALVAAKDRLLARFHALDSREIARHAHGGWLGTSLFLGEDPDLLAWMRFRVESMTEFFYGVRQCLDAHLSHKVKLGVGPRSAAFAPLCGYDMPTLATFLDVLLPKHYFWQRGFDGMVGTVTRYVETLTLWNPGLADEDALAVVEGLFGLVLPGVQNRSDLEEALTPAFFEQIVTQETRRALAAVDDPARIVPWVDAGRFPHDGDPISAGDLRRMLRAAEAAGLQRFVYHHAGNLTAGEWAVMSEMCGRPWRPLESKYKPPDQMVL
jgi:hypothetical protein